MAVPSSSHNPRIGSSSSSADRNTSDPFQAYLGGTEGLANSVFAAQSTATTANGWTTNNPSGPRHHQGSANHMQGHQPSEGMRAANPAAPTQWTGGMPPRGTVKGGMPPHIRGRSLQGTLGLRMPSMSLSDPMVAPQLASTASSPALGELLLLSSSSSSSATYPVAAAPSRSTPTSSASLSPTALAYTQGAPAPSRPTRQSLRNHYHSAGAVSGQVRGEVPPLAEQYPPTQYSTTEMVLAEFGPDYANLSKRDLLRIIRRHAPDAFLEEYNLKGQIYNAIKSRSHSQFVQLAEQLMENYMVYCGFQNGASIPTDPQVAATAASVASKMGVAGGSNRMPSSVPTQQQHQQQQTQVTSNGPAASRHGGGYDGRNTQFFPTQEELSESEVNTPPPGFESIMPNAFSQALPLSSSAHSEDLAPSLSSFDNFTTGSVLAERGSSAASNLSVDAPSFTPSVDYSRGGFTSSWDAVPAAADPPATTSLAPDDSLAKLAEQLMRSYGFGRAEAASPFGPLATSPRNAPTTGTNVSVAGSGPHTGSTNASNSSDSVDFGSFGGFSGQFDLGTTGTSGASSSSSHLSATAATFTPSNSSWWNPLNSAVSSSSISESPNVPRRPVVATGNASHSMPGHRSEVGDPSTLASLIASLSSSSASSTSPSSPSISSVHVPFPQDEACSSSSHSTSNGVIEINSGKQSATTTTGKQASAAAAASSTGAGSPITVDVTSLPRSDASIPAAASPQ
ncbi:hypothetical protein FOL47_009737 [Perkinsus chesapeaki]|uniref:FKBP3 basic tilted helix bundle domain-containing protein n=1 Tax=Perkinsus chesapeaki TaxID=330153 RepID=A0A7J6N269_PERCH|nr:hypothetical protein FOL47_009737 [Perkinsus chesapeaki]